jgi:hypothetical protein
MAKAASLRIYILVDNIKDLLEVLVLDGDTDGKHTENNLLFSSLLDQCHRCRKFGHHYITNSLPK